MTDAGLTPLRELVEARREEIKANGAADDIAHEAFLKVRHRRQSI